MIVVDVESTGMDPWKHGILSIGGVDLEHPTRQFYAECHPFEGAHIMDEALAVNGFTREGIAHITKSEGDIIREFFAWAEQAEEKTFIGHNPTFDFSIIRLAAERNHINFPFARRTIDTHTVCYTHMLLHGHVPPREKGHSALNSDSMLAYVGLPSEPRPHNGLTGAKVEAEAVSRLWYGKPLLEEFKQFPIPWK